MTFGRDLPRGRRGRHCLRRQVHAARAAPCITIFSRSGPCCSTPCSGPTTRSASSRSTCEQRRFGRKRIGSSPPTRRRSRTPPLRLPISASGQRRSRLPGPSVAHLPSSARSLLQRRKKTRTWWKPTTSPCVRQGSRSSTGPNTRGIRIRSRFATSESRRPTSRVWPSRRPGRRLGCSAMNGRKACRSDLYLDYYTKRGVGLGTRLAWDTIDGLGKLLRLHASRRRRDRLDVYGRTA